ncbi:hypothetical protein A2870_01900 [Candidatus Curtissbacteria bacterium RIFCSPHIGHO2_01_FULL_41_11]|uniref:Uncharacterized protein n=1 Tax=Candidatus Curtissbacteria bacterium RIFCSPHIGHO2_01_FULL_41_11 TaxID=1797711 RepID=A0A1F5G3Z7_9BACT|nr:MAG: hypothetical protein A2870_01900 [Candidatus Curtissbacteria bacterium RIFCSPHIGHO2_01_FULL_41_11]
MKDLLAASFSIKNEFTPANRFATTGDLVSNIIIILTSFAGALALIFIIIGGIKFITAAGDEKKMQSATQTLTYAIIGLIVTALAFIILRIVQQFLGSNVAIT